MGSERRPPTPESALNLGAGRPGRLGLRLLWAALSPAVSVPSDVTSRELSFVHTPAFSTNTSSGPHSSHGRCAGKGRGGQAGGVLPSGASWRVPDRWTRGTPGVSSPGAQSQPAGGPLGTQGRWVPDAARGGTGAGKVLGGQDPRGGWALRGEGREEAGGCSRQREHREPRPSQRQPGVCGPGWCGWLPGRPPRRAARLP